MKPQRNYMEVESTLVGEDVAMGIDLSSMPHLMNVLTDLYEDRELACLREYSTNAWDANRDAGNTDPIRVSLPGALRPLLVIEDSGEGLDAEDIRSIYSQYGASTKRGSDDAVGMLGLGCKSALTYTDQFTLVSVKDGTKTTVSISRDDAGSGVMKILAQEQTDEPSGTAVQIPARRDNEFQAKAAAFFRFWEPGSVLVDGQEPKPLDGLRLSDDLIVLDDEQQDWVVMGNVPYPAKLGIYDNGGRYSYGTRQSVVARVPIGAVNFTPSRESLMDTDQTEQTLSQIRGDFARYAKTAVQDAVDKATTKSEALLAFAEANGLLPSKYRIDAAQVSYKGEGFPAWPDARYGSRISSSGHKHGLTRGAPDLLSAVKAIWVTGYDNDHWTGQNRTKLEAYMDAHGKDTNPQRPIVIYGGKLNKFYLEWLPDDHVVVWETVRKWQPPRDPNAGPVTPKPRGRYNAYNTGMKYPYVDETDADLVPQDDTVFWVECRKYAGGDHWDELKRYSPDNAKRWLILLPANRIDKFKRDFPKARELRPYIAEQVKAKIKAMTTAQLIALRYRENSIVTDLRRLALPADKLDDPQLQQVLRWIELVPKADRTLKAAMQEYGVKWPSRAETDLFSVCHARYPLLSTVSYHADTNELVFYANAAYAARKE